MQTIVKFFTKYRLLDGYIGVLNFVFWYKFLAGYSSWFYIIDLTAKNAFSFSVTYHPGVRVFYPPVTAHLKLFRWMIFDTAAEAARRTSEQVEGIMKQHRADETKKDELFKAWKDAQDAAPQGAE